MQIDIYWGKVRSLAVVLSLLIAHISALAQSRLDETLDHYEIMFSNIIFDHGKVEDWTNPPAEYYITNTGEIDLILTPSDSNNRELRITIETDTLRPGETTLAKAWFYPMALGPFSRQILIDVKGMDYPVDLYVKGEVVSFPDSENELPRDQFGINNIVLLIDVSSSMRLPQKLPLLKESIKSVVSNLRDIDFLTVVTYSSEILNPVEHTRVINKPLIYEQIDSLFAGGRSRGAGALHQSYYILKKYYIPGANNQVIIATDGIFNDTKFTEKDLFNMVEMHSEKDKITTTAFGFGTDKESRKFMEKLAKAGKGAYYNMEKLGDMESALLEEIKERSSIDNL